MMCCDSGSKGDKGGELALLGLGIPLLGLLLLPLGLLLLAALIPALIFFIGRSNDGGGISSLIPGMPNLDLLRTIDEATTAFDALAHNEKCRQKVACQLGYIFKGSEKKARTLS